MHNKFDPLGTGYDYDGSMASMGYDGVPAQSPIVSMEGGHYPSRDPMSGLLFKGAMHPTFHKTVEAESQMGNQVYQAPDGRIYSNTVDYQTPEIRQEVITFPPVESWMPQLDPAPVLDTTQFDMLPSLDGINMMDQPMPMGEPIPTVGIRG